MEPHAIYGVPIFMISRYKKDLYLSQIYYRNKQRCTHPHLVLEQSQRTLDHNVLEDGTRGDVNR
jgi:hypothetical protein